MGDLQKDQQFTQPVGPAETGLPAFQALADQSIVGVCVISNGAFTYVSRRFEEIFGYAPGEIIARITPADLIDRKERERRLRMIRLVMDNELHTIRDRIRGIRRDGTAVHLDTEWIRAEDPSGPSVIGIILDRTEQARTEKELKEAQRLKSLGVFAAEVAHEFNNILTAIVGNLSLAKMYAKPGYEVFDILSDAEKASARARDLTTQLLAFAKGDNLVRKVIVLQHLLGRIMDTVPTPENIRFECLLPDDVSPIEGDEKQIADAFQNLVVNAIQAMPEGGVIRIKAGNVTLPSGSGLPLPPGKYVVVTVEDEGVGMPEEMLQSIFDPFYKTWEAGPGLGLPSSYSIIKQHHGHMIATSTPGEGTTFVIYLPATEKRFPSGREGMQLLGEGKGKILVMDDDEIVRTVLGRLLVQCGYEPELSKDGQEMVDMYAEAKAAGKPYDAVITDLVVQEGMGGQEAIKQLLAMDPGAKVIVSSGYSDDSFMEHYLEFGCSGMLAKPYRIEELTQVLHDVISPKR